MSPNLDRLMRVFKLSPNVKSEKAEEMRCLLTFFDEANLNMDGSFS